MQLYLYIKHDTQPSLSSRVFLNSSSFDERIFVRCTPQEILLSGSMGRNSNHKHNNDNNNNKYDDHENRHFMKAFPADRTVSSSSILASSLLPSLIPTSVMSPSQESSSSHSSHSWVSSSPPSSVKRLESGNGSRLSSSSGSINNKKDNKVLAPDDNNAEDENPSRILIKTMDGGDDGRFSEEASFISSVQRKIDCQMDIMRGRIPFLKPIDPFKPVDVGDEVTVIIRMNHIGQYVFSSEGMKDEEKRLYT